MKKYVIGFVLGVASVMVYVVTMLVHIYNTEERWLSERSQ